MRHTRWQLFDTALLKTPRDKMGLVLDCASADVVVAIYYCIEKPMRLTILNPKVVLRYMYVDSKVALYWMISG